MAALFAVSLIASASAQDVELRSFDGGIELSGTLIGFDGEYYRVESIFGPLTVAAQGVTCRGPGCPDLENFVAEVSFQGAPEIANRLFPALIERFAASRNMSVRRQILAENRSVFALIREESDSVAARFFVTATTTDAGFEALLDRSADVVLASRVPDAAEQEAAEASDQGDLSMIARSRVLALDALVPLVAPVNILDGITIEELARVFAGEITDWSTLGGPDAAISLHLIAPDTGHGQDIGFRIMAPFDLTPSDTVIHHATARDLTEAVARDPFAIGIGTLSAAGNARVVDLQGACGFTSAATPNAIKSEDYPLTAPLLLYLPVRRMPQLARDFFRFFESQEADRVIRRLGFVNQGITSAPLSSQGDRLANAISAAGEEIDLGDLQEMIAAMNGAQRLSATFRFEDGTTELDAQSRSAISRLARAIERGVFDGQELVFVGFSDATGAASANLRLARGRAEAARLAVIEAASDGDLNRVRLSIDAFGEALPMACDDDPAGRAVNRRVEVWLR